MTLLPGSLDYTDKDFDSLRLRLISLIRSVFPTWTDYNVLSFGNILMELAGFIGDVIGYYQDAQANESKWSVATQRASIIKLAKLIGYELPGASAATVVAKLSLQEPPAGSLTIPAGDYVRTPEVTDPVRFQLLADAVFTAGMDPPEVSVDAENSESRTDSFSSNGQKDQRFLLTFTPYLDDSLSMSDDVGAWTEVENFLDSGANDRHYTVQVDQNDRAIVTTGDGQNGAIPQGTIDMAYKIGGGLEGNVEQGAISVVESNYVDSLGNNVIVSVTNESEASGGGPRQSLETARILGPASIRAPRTTVSREDYEIHALKVTGVARALMLTSDQEPAMDENQGYLFIVPRGGGTPTQTLLDQVLEMVTETYPNTITFKTFVVAATYKTINVSATVFLRQGQTEAGVKAAINANLSAYFALYVDEGTDDEAPNVNVDFGYNYKDEDGNPAGEVAWSDIFNVVRDTAGVRKVTSFYLNSFDDDAALGNREFPVLGTVEIINGATGLPL